MQLGLLGGVCRRCTGFDHRQRLRQFQRFGFGVFLDFRPEGAQFGFSTAQLIGQGIGISLAHDGSPTHPLAATAACVRLQSSKRRIEVN